MEARCGIVRSSISAVVKKTPFFSSRSIKLRQWAREIFDSSFLGGNKQHAFEKFSFELIGLLQVEIEVIAGSYKSSSQIKEHLWSRFHMMQWKGMLSSLWKELMENLDMHVDDSLLEQSVFQEVFEMLVHDWFIKSSSSGSSLSASAPNDITITVDELNVMRYVCGYVVRSLLKRYEKSTGGDCLELINCLDKMVVVGEDELNDDSVWAFTEKWISIVNRGGLFVINGNTLQLFIEIEKCVRFNLKLHFGKDTFKKKIKDKILGNDDVQCCWALLSQEIDKSDNAQFLLNDIIELWITIRGFSMVASWVEQYKTIQRKNTQKSTVLRKSLS
jgi:hypothetical protein